MKYEEIRKMWIEYAKEFYWRDNFDVRFIVLDYLENLKHKNILDLGCGPGILHKFIDNSNNVIGIDNNEKALKIAKKINPKFKYIKGDIKDESLYPKKYDVILLLHVIEYFKNQRKEEIINFLNKVGKHLKKDGILILTTPNQNNGYYLKKNKWRYEEVEEILKGKNLKLKVKEKILWNPISIKLSKLYMIHIIWPMLKILSKKLKSKNCVSLLYILEKI